MEDRYLFRGKRIDNGEWVVEKAEAMRESMMIAGNTLIIKEAIADYLVEVKKKEEEDN